MRRRSFWQQLSNLKIFWIITLNFIGPLSNIWIVGRSPSTPMDLQKDFLNRLLEHFWSVDVHTTVPSTMRLRSQWAYLEHFLKIWTLVLEKTALVRKIRTFAFSKNRTCPKNQDFCVFAKKEQSWKSDFSIKFATHARTDFNLTTVFGLLFLKWNSRFH